MSWAKGRDVIEDLLSRGTSSSAALNRCGRRRLR